MQPTEPDQTISYDSHTNTYRLSHNWQGDESVATAVTRGVAVLTNTPPTDMAPLFETLNSDALNHLFDQTDGDSARDAGWVSFQFHGCTVIVDAAGTIEITPAEDTTPITASVPRTLRDR